VQIPDGALAWCNSLSGTFPCVSTVSLTPFLNCKLSHWHLFLCDMRANTHTASNPQNFPQSPNELETMWARAPPNTHTHMHLFQANSVLLFLEKEHFRKASNLIDWALSGSGLNLCLTNKARDRGGADLEMHQEEVDVRFNDRAHQPRVLAWWTEFGFFHETPAQSGWWEMYDFTRDSIWFTMVMSMFRTQARQKVSLRHVPKALLRSFCEVVY